MNTITTTVKRSTHSDGDPGLDFIYQIELSSDAKTLLRSNLVSIEYHHSGRMEVWTPGYARKLATTILNTLGSVTEAGPAQPSPARVSQSLRDRTPAAQNGQPA